MSMDSGPGINQYTVQAGDTLWDLANDYNTNIEDIMAANPGIDPDNLQVGQVIALVDPQPTRGNQRGLKVDMNVDRMNIVVDQVSIAEDRSIIDHIDHIIDLIDHIIHIHPMRVLARQEQGRTVCNPVIAFIALLPGLAFQ